MKTEEALARGLGWFSIGLGLTELIAPEALGRGLGMENRSGLLRAYGAREIGAGVGILSQRSPRRYAPWLWGRVGGDILDLATLASALSAGNPKRGNVGFALAAVAGITALDIITAVGMQKIGSEQREAAGESTDPKTVERSLTIGGSTNQLYEIWRRPQTLGQVMGHFARVTPLDTDRAHWYVEAPLGQNLQWDSRIVEDRPGDFVQWESVDGATVPNRGSVRFRPAPANLGTEVTLSFHFDPPGGAAGEVAAKLLHAVPEMAAYKALRRFKSLVETGEIPTTAPQPAARADKD